MIKKLCAALALGLGMTTGAFAQDINFGIISRQPGASTATGYTKVHQKEQAEIIDKAFTI